MSARIYVEGGGDSKELHTRCREGFRRLLERCGFSGRMPRLVACGSRGSTYDDFSTAHKNAGPAGFVAMLIDSEDPVADRERTWGHLQARDGWDRPTSAHDEQVLFMTTCMETWIAADRQALRDHYGPSLHEHALPDLTDIESRIRHAIQDALVQATRPCRTGYAKGKQSFVLVARIAPEMLRQHLPSFVRCERILRERL